MSRQCLLPQQLLSVLIHCLHLPRRDLPHRYCCLYPMHGGVILQQKHENWMSNRVLLYYCRSHLLINMHCVPSRHLCFYHRVH